MGQEDINMNWKNVSQNLGQLPINLVEITKIVKRTFCDFMSNVARFSSRLSPFYSIRIYNELQIEIPQDKHNYQGSNSKLLILTKNFRLT